MAARQALVIGLGRFGSAVGRRLEALGHEVLGLDQSQRELDLSRDGLTQTLLLDASDIDQLRQIGVPDFDVVVVAIGDDIEASVLAAANARELGARELIAKARTAQHARILERVGATRVVFPEDDMGARVADVIAQAGLLDRMQVAPGVIVAELATPASLVGLTLREAELRRRGISVVCVKDGRHVELAPDPDAPLRAGTVLVVAGAEAGIDQLVRVPAAARGR